MIDTQLPDKKNWAGTLEAFRAKFKIQKQDIADDAELSAYYVRKVFDGTGTLEQMKSVETSIGRIIHERHS
jgi:hypothetical protein